MFLRTAALFIAVIFGVQSAFLAHAAEANFWKERKAKGQGQLARLPQTMLDPIPTPVSLSKTSSLQSGFSANTTHSPLENTISPFGQIQEQHKAQDKNAPSIVLIQDIHGLDEAQLNAAKLMTQLNSDHGYQLVGLEGAEGKFAVESFRAYPNTAIRTAIADHYLSEGIIGGAEYVSLTAEKTPELWGVESLADYRANIAAYKAAQQERARLTQIVEEYKKKVTSQKETIYSAALKRFDREQMLYQQENGNLTRYVTYLLKNNPNASSESIANLTILKRALDAEKSLDIEKVQRQKKNLVTRLADKASKTQLESLVRISVAYRNGQISYLDYTRFLKRFCQNIGVSLKRFDELMAYMDYVELAETISRIDIVSELDRFEIVVQNSLIENEAQRKVVTFQKYVTYLGKLVRSEMTPSEWASYQTIKTQFSPIKEADAFEKFFVLALKRDRNIVENLVSKMKADGHMKAVLVAGGFHTKGIARRLKEKDHSYIVVTPKVGDLDHSDPYLNIFTRDPLPIEKLFSGKQINLVGQRMMSPANAGLGVEVPAAQFATLYNAAATAMGESTVNSGTGALPHVDSVETSVQPVESRFYRLVRYIINWSNGRRASLQAAVTSEDNETETRRAFSASPAQRVLLVVKAGATPIRLVVLFFPWAATSLANLGRMVFQWVSQSAGPVAQPMVSALHQGKTRDLIHMMIKQSMNPVVVRANVIQAMPFRIRILNRLFGLWFALVMASWIARSYLQLTFAEQLSRVLDQSEIGRANLEGRVETSRQSLEDLFLARQMDLDALEINSVRVEVFDEAQVVESQFNFILAPMVRYENGEAVFYVSRRFLEEVENEETLKTLVNREIRYQELLNQGVNFDRAHLQVTQEDESQLNLVGFAQLVSREVIREARASVQVDGTDSFSRNPDQRDIQEEEQRSLENRIPGYHSEIKNRVGNGEVQLTGGLSEFIVGQLKTIIEGLKMEGTRHVVLVGDELDVSVQAVLEYLTPQSNWNAFLKENGLPQIHLLESTDQKTVDQIAAAIPEYERKSVAVVWAGERNETWDPMVKELKRKLNVGSLNQVTSRGGVISRNTLPLLVAGIIDFKLLDGIYDGARGAFEDWENLSDETSKEYDAYLMAQNSARLAYTGQNMHVFMMFSTKLRHFSSWVSNLFNQMVGLSPVNVSYSGEFSTSYFHSTQQGHRQSRGLDEQQNRKGFISLFFLSPEGGRDATVGQQAHPHYRGMGYRFLHWIFRAAYSLAMFNAHRPITRVDISMKTPQDIGRFIHFVQTSANMTAMMTNAPEGTGHTLSEATEKPSQGGIKVEPKEGEIQVRQNILDFDVREGEVSLTGVLGEEVRSKLGGSDESLWNALVGVTLDVKNRLTSAVLERFRGGAQLDHLNPETVEKDLDPSEKAANLFKKKKRIYAIAIGGSTTGPIAADTLDLEEGPEIIEVQSLDGDQISEIIDSINEAENPEDIGVVIISKSGVTTETDANGWTVVEALERALQAKDESLDIKNQVMFVTDPQLGTLRAKSEREGWLTLDHPILIGGRWSMFSSVGLFYYFVKGGSRSDLEDALNEMKDWDAGLQEAIEIIGAVEDDLRGDDEQAKLRALKKIAEALQKDQGVWTGFLDNVTNRLLGRDTEVGLAWDRSFEQLISHKNPFYSQLRVESKSKPGVRFYTFAVWGWNMILMVWNRIIGNKKVYVTLFSEAPADSSSQIDAANQNRWDQVQNQLDKEGVPFMAVRAGPMTVKTLLNLMMFQYRRLAVDAALYQPMDVDSEGQDGVEESKGFARAFLGRLSEIAASIRNSFTTFVESLAAQLRFRGLPIPHIPTDEIESANEIEIDVAASFGFKADVARLITNFVRGDELEPGLATVGFLDRVKRLTSNNIPSAMRQFFLDQASLNDNNIESMILDGASINGTVPSSASEQKSRFVVRTTSLETPNNLPTGTANGSNFGVYERDETGQLVLLASVQILWGSGVRVIISDGEKSQDYILKGDNRLIEVDRAGDSNAMTMAVKGKHLASGGISSERPQGFNQYEQGIEWWLNTSVRFSDTLSGDTSLMMDKQGRLNNWVTWGEAFELAQIMGAASGSTMIMTDTGMTHVGAIRLTEGLLKSQERIYVYGGNPDNVRQIQIFLDYLKIKTEKDQPIVLRLLELINAVTKENTTPALRATAIMWLLSLQEGLNALPQTKALRGEMKDLVSELRDQVPALLKKLNRDATVRELEQEYHQLSLQDKMSRMNQFVLLGDRSVYLKFHPMVGRGDEMRAVYELERLFRETSPSDLLSQLIAQLVENDLGQLSREVEEMQRQLRQSYRSDNLLMPETTPDPLPEQEFGESFGYYLSESLGLTDEMAERMGVEGNSLPQEGQDIFNMALELYLQDTDVTELLDQEEEMRELRAREPSIFEERGGRVFVKSLRYIRQKLKENKYDPSVNLSGDVSSRLDEIYNTIFIYNIRNISDVIISEENDDPVIGKRSVTVESKTGARYVLFLDPIDGSSQVKGGFPFGAIFTLGFLDRDQKYSEFDPMKQIISSFDVQFGWPRDVLSLTNRHNVKKDGKAEVVQFELTDNDTTFKHVGEFQHFDRLLDGLSWDGLLPTTPDGRYIGFAMGGSFKDTLPSTGHTEVIQWLISNFPYLSGYTGALVNDIRKSMTIGSRAMGILNSYAATGKNIDGRLRVSFELWHIAVMYDILGGEVTDGIVPMFDRRMPDQEPGGLEAEFYGGSRWITKIIMGWRNHVKSTFGSKPIPEDEIGKFIKSYDSYGKKFIRDVIQYATEHHSHTLSEDEVRKAVFQLEGDIFPLLSTATGEEGYNRLFKNNNDQSSDSLFGEFNWGALLDQVQEQFRQSFASFLSPLSGVLSASVDAVALLLSKANRQLRSSGETSYRSVVESAIDGLGLQGQFDVDQIQVVSTLPTATDNRHVDDQFVTLSVDPETGRLSIYIHESVLNAWGEREATSPGFVRNAIALTIVHELGHQQGLTHDELVERGLDLDALDVLYNSALTADQILIELRQRSLLALSETAAISVQGNPLPQSTTERLALAEQALSVLVHPPLEVMLSAPTGGRDQLEEREAARRQRFVELTEALTTGGTLSTRELAGEVLALAQSNGDDWQNKFEAILRKLAALHANGDSVTLRQIRIDQRTTRVSNATRAFYQQRDIAWVYQLAFLVGNLSSTTEEARKQSAQTLTSLGQAYESRRNSLASRTSSFQAVDEAVSSQAPVVFEISAAMLDPEQRLTASEQSAVNAIAALASRLSQTESEAPVVFLLNGVPASVGASQIIRALAQRTNIEAEAFRTLLNAHVAVAENVPGLVTINGARMTYNASALLDYLSSTLNRAQGEAVQVFALHQPGRSWNQTGVAELISIMILLAEDSVQRLSITDRIGSFKLSAIAA